MKCKPTYYYGMAIFFLIVAFTPFVQILFMGQHELVDLNMVFRKMSYWNLLTMGLGVGLTVLSATASPWLKFGIPALTLCVFLNNIQATYALNGANAFAPIFASLLFLTIILFFVSRDTFFRSLNQKFRWWETPERYQKSLKVLVKMGGEKLGEFHTYDLSSSGLFLTSLPTDLLAKVKYALGAEFELVINSTVHGQIACRAQAVRVSVQKNGKYPSGAGLKIAFDDFRQKSRYSLLMDGLASGKLV